MAAIVKDREAPEAGAGNRERVGRTRRERREAPRLRLAVELFFLLLTVALVWQYHRFVGAVLAGAESLPPRPNGAEAFLPIAGVISLFHLLTTGEYDPVHPAALTLVLAAIATSFLLRKAFCAWVCPVGALSEWWSALGKWCWGRLFRLPRWADRPLLALKYLLLGFFLFGIVRAGDYYYYEFDRHADVGMYGYWFWGRYGVTMIVFATLIALWGIFTHAPWCRYLCPYGALLGIFSRFSPARIARDAERCTNCGLCAHRCPAALPVDRLASVGSAECTACLTCVAVCPVRDTLDLRAGGRRLAPRRAAALVLAAFLGMIGLAMVTGRWRSNLTEAEYRRVIPQMRTGPRMPHRW
ncbi:MAG: 4Fe-4S binding protein [Armatimonadetes bacterium]|nr:4Fe-4S binding protein [Armatimonadota bacterium]